MRKITCMVVEDEPVSQEILKRYIEDYGSLELLAVCNNAIEASHEISKLAPELLFLDITMPRLSGLDFYKTLHNPPPVIFTTAYPEYAVSGFEVSAVDYLLKPFTFERFVKSMNKVREAVSNTGKRVDGFITVQADKKLYKVQLSEIMFVEAMGDYVKLKLADKLLIVHETLQRFLEKLPRTEFCRVHKSYAVALKRIEYVEGNMIVIGTVKIPIGQTYRSDLMEILHPK
jgi:DNA-binding LytR/AlgR family response regulator